MSTIALTRHFDGFESILIYKTLVAAAKGDDVRVRAVTLNYLLANGRSNLSAELMKAIKNSAHWKSKEENAAASSALFHFSETVKQIFNNSALEPHIAIGLVLERFKEFRVAQNLPYIKINHILDNALVDLTVNQVARKPTYARDIIDTSIEAFVRARDREDVHGIKLKLPNSDAYRAIRMLNKLKGLCELVNKDNLKKLNYGDTAKFPMAIVDVFKTNLQYVLSGQSGIFSSASQLINMTSRFKGYPTGPAGMMTLGMAPKWLKRVPLVLKLNEVYQTAGATELKKKCHFLEGNLRTVSLSCLPGMIKLDPAMIGLFKNKAFVDAAETTAVFHFINESTRLLPYYSSKKFDVHFGPLTPLSLVNRLNKEDLLKYRTIADFKPSAVEEWEQNYPGIPTDSVVIKGVIYSKQNDLYQEHDLVKTLNRGARF